MRFSMTLAASSAARTVPVAALGRDAGFAASPISTKRRMASDRGGLSSSLAAHSSTAARNSADSLIAVTGSRPVAGRPPLFGFGTTDVDFDMFW